jgi:hypothetical protein
MLNHTQPYLKTASIAILLITVITTISACSSGGSGDDASSVVESHYGSNNRGSNLV